jgi:hypothetical protein
MNNLARREIPEAAPEAFAEAGELIASLRATGADRFDPAGFHYIEALARRANEHQGRARQLLDVKLKQALAMLKKRFDLAQCDARDAVARSVQHYPAAADNLHELLDGGDFKGVQRLIAQLKIREQCASLSGLVRRLEQHSPEQVEVPRMKSAGPRPELRTIRNFRNTWSKLSVDKQVAQALEQAPKNAGPINSHMLVLRSLALMREVSQDYLNRFITYADTLLCLDQGEQEKPASPKKPRRAKAAKK